MAARPESDSDAVAAVGRGPRPATRGCTRARLTRDREGRGAPRRAVATARLGPRARRPRTAKAGDHATGTGHRRGPRDPAEFFGFCLTHTGQAHRAVRSASLRPTRRAERYARATRPHKGGTPRGVGADAWADPRGKAGTPGVSSARGRRPACGGPACGGDPGFRRGAIGTPRRAWSRTSAMRQLACTIRQMRSPSRLRTPRGSAEMVCPSCEGGATKASYRTVVSSRMTEAGSRGGRSGHRPEGVDDERWRATGWPSGRSTGVGRGGELATGACPWHHCARPSVISVTLVGCHSVATCGCDGGGVGVVLPPLLRLLPGRQLPALRGE